MGNPFNPYNPVTTNYSSTCYSVTGRTVTGYNVPTKSNVSTTK